jgi:hypothetical protein
VVEWVGGDGEEAQAGITVLLPGFVSLMVQRLRALLLEYACRNDRRSADRNRTEGIKGANEIKTWKI